MGRSSKPAPRLPQILGAAMPPSSASCSCSCPQEARCGGQLSKLRDTHLHGMSTQGCADFKGVRKGARILWPCLPASEEQPSPSSNALPLLGSPPCLPRPSSPSPSWLCISYSLCGKNQNLSHAEDFAGFSVTLAPGDIEAFIVPMSTFLEQRQSLSFRAILDPAINLRFPLMLHV